MDITIALQAVINTLDGIEVKGKDNIRAMLNCIDTLAACVSAISDARKEADDGRTDTENDQ